MNGKNMYIPPDVLKEIGKIKIETGITSTADALRILVRRRNTQTGGGFRI